MPEVLQNNALILRLPLEVLSLVFLRLRQACDDRTWLHILHVCRQWRTAAIGYAQLWTNIPDMKSRSLRSFMLKQSKTLPITLRGIRMPKNSSCQVLDNRAEFKQILKKHVHRCRVLGLVVGMWYSHGLSEWLEKTIAPTAAPLLKTLEITIDYDDHGSRYDVYLPNILLGISSLSVNNGFLEFRWTPGWSRVPTEPLVIQDSITSFSISFPYASVPPLDRYIRRLFGRMPNLTYLEVTDEDMRRTPGSSVDTVPLLRLRMLRYSGYMCSCLSLLRALELSPITALDLRVILPSSYSSEHLDELSGKIAQLLRSRRDAHDDSVPVPTYDVWFSVYSSSPLVYSQHITVFEASHDCLHTLHSAGALSTGESHRLPILNVHYAFQTSTSYTIRSRPVFLSSFVRAAIHTVPGSISSIRIQTEHPFRTHCAETFVDRNFSSLNGSLSEDAGFFACPSVVSLQLADPESAKFVAPFLRVRQHEVIPRSSSPINGEAEFIAFPNLKTLILPRAESDAVEETSQAALGARLSKDVMEQLKEAVEARTDAGKELEIIEMGDTGGLKGYLENLLKNELWKGKDWA